MTTEYASKPSVSGRTHWIILTVLVLVVLAFFVFSERVGPPPGEPETISVVEPDEPAAIQSDALTSSGDQSSPVIETGPEALQSARSEWSESEQQTSAPVQIEPSQVDERLYEQIVSSLQPDQVAWIVQDRLIERLVVTINGLDGDGVPLRMRPLSHVPGLPAVVAEGASWHLPNTADPRYQPYREMLDHVDTDQMVSLYRSFQPAFEQAWTSLGRLDTDFETRLQDVIDHLLAFEYPDDPLELIRPEVLYEFADPALEQLTWGHKLLIRIGPEHANALQLKLSAIRNQLLSSDRSGTDAGAG